ncbi:oligosaccharide flippase family protein [Deinococcus sp. A31D244]|uniref:oligosaccharide flippase family protein n=1 Tax=Deinococcus sp. A31D244 TaxID=3397675 RepID=UPI0039E0FCDC
MYFIRLSQLMFPIFSIPFLARSLGVSSYGEILLIQSFAAVMGIFIEFGFNVSGPAYLAQANTKEEVENKIRGVFSAKIIILTLVLFVFLVYSLIESKSLLFIASISTLAIIQGFSPLWIAQGTERISKISKIEFIFRLTVFLVTFSVVPTWGTAGYLLNVTFFGLIMVFLQYKILYKDLNVSMRSIGLSIRDGISSIREDMSIAIFRIGSSAYTTGSLVILSFFIPAGSFAIYAGIEKIFRSSLNVLSPITEVLYPQIIKRGSKNFTIFASFLTIFISLILAGVLYFYGGQIIYLMLGEKFISGLNILKMLSAVVPLIAVGTIIYMYILLPSGMKNAFSFGTILAGTYTIVMIAILSDRLDVNVMPIALIGAELIIIMVGLVGILRVRKNNYE